MFENRISKIVLASLAIAASACTTEPAAEPVEDATTVSASNNEQASSANENSSDGNERSNEAKATLPTSADPNTEPDKTKYTEASKSASAAVGCSAAGISVPPSDPGLGTGVRETRDAILAAAVACDYDALQKVVDLSPDLVSNFGEEPNHIHYWKDLEDNGEEPLKSLVTVLSTEHAVIGTGLDKTHFWPEFAHSLDCEAEEEFFTFYPESMEAVDYSPEEYKKSCDETGNGYYGYRTRIHAGGKWEMFVAGD